METTYSFLAGVFFAGLVLIWGFRVLSWVWIRPKKMERCLRKQGFFGNSYKLFFGDLKLNSTMIQQARSNPINLSDDIVPRVIPFLHQTVQNYGKNSYMWVGPVPRVNIMEPRLIKEIMSKNFHFQKPKLSPFLKLLATGLVDYEDQKWAMHRKIIKPAFHLEKLKQMVPAMYLSCNEMLSKWESMIMSNNTTNGSLELDVWPYLSTLSSDVISRTAFGSSYEEGGKIFQLQREQGDYVMEALQSLYIPGFRFVPTKRNMRMKEIDLEVQASLKGIVGRRMKSIEAGEATNNDLLGILLESNFKEIQQNKNNMSFGMGINDIIEECKLFYLAGQETTSVLLVWIMILLSSHQKWQQLAREEVFQVFGSNKPDFDGLNRLKTVTMILYEVLRLYPPVAFLFRKIYEDTNLGEMLLPAGVQITLPTILIHHDREIWGDDAKEFKPERFSEGISKATKGQFSFFPFGWGPRICIGQNFAMLETKMALALILQDFSFELSPSYTHAPNTVVTLQPQYGAHLILHKVQV